MFLEVRFCLLLESGRKQFLKRTNNSIGEPSGWNHYSLAEYIDSDKYNIKFSCEHGNIENVSHTEIQILRLLPIFIFAMHHNPHLQDYRVAKKFAFQLEYSSDPWGKYYRYVEIQFQPDHSVVLLFNPIQKEM